MCQLLLQPISLKMKVVDVPSIRELKSSLPAHCFRSSLALSLYYFARDLVLIALLFTTLLITEQLGKIVYYLFLPFYWFMQSTIIAGLFVVGHDCGHGSFSSSSLVNDVVGNVAHMVCLTPYYPWKLSHRNHHKNTGNMDRDEVFYPTRISESSKSTALFPFFGLGMGWFIYLLRGYSPRRMNHFNPFDPMLIKHAGQCIISLALITLWVALVFIPYANKYGFWALASHMVVPVLGFATWMVIITFLHHHDDQVPWYGDDNWNFVKGQLSTVDRKYGLLFDDLLHHIGTHQIHHLFTKIPHYHLQEATAVFRAKYPHLVRKSDENLALAFLRMFKVFSDQCTVDDKTQLHVYDTSI